MSPCARYTCAECVEGLEMVGAYMRDPLWVAEYTLYLEQEFCPGLHGAEERCGGDEMTASC